MFCFYRSSKLCRFIRIRVSLIKARNILIGIKRSFLVLYLPPLIIMEYFLLLDFLRARNFYEFLDFHFQEERVQTKYPWNEYEVNMIIGGFFWGYICTEFPGGRLAEIIGTKRVFGYSMLVSSFITLLTPLSATFGYTAVVALRVILGFMMVRLLFHLGFILIIINVHISPLRLVRNDLTNENLNLSSIFLCT